MSHPATGRPVRWLLACITYRLIWWPVVVVVFPFVLLGVLAELLSEHAYPPMKAAVSAIHDFAVSAADAVWGGRKEWSDR